MVAEEKMEQGWPGPRLRAAAHIEKEARILFRIFVPTAGILCSSQSRNLMYIRASTSGIFIFS